MQYMPMEDVNIFASEAYKDSYQVASLNAQQAKIVGDIANSEVPPSAINQAAVTENCQGWVVRVITKFVTEGIVAQSWLTFARSMQQPLNGPYC